MKLMMAVTAFALSLTVQAQACPNLNGEYAFDKAWNGSVVITQKGCEEITFKHIRADGSSFSETKRVDGKKYEGLYDSLVLVTDPSYRYDHHASQYVNGRIVMNSFEGAAKDCEGKYSFSNFECKLFEHSYGYDENGVFTKTQVGSWRGADGRYEDEIFTMKKIR